MKKISEFDGENEKVITRRNFFKEAGKASLSFAAIPMLGGIACYSRKNNKIGAMNALLALNQEPNPNPDPDDGPQANKVYMAKNGDCFQNVAKVFEMMGGISTIIDQDDVVVIKGNGQWPNRGYTHTGCIKAVIDEILAIPHYSGEIFICDNVQEYGSSGEFGFDATISNRTDNWPDHNWNSLAAAYRTAGKPVTSKKWITSTGTISGPADGEGWIRDFFDFHGNQAYLSYPIFASSLVPGRMIDMKNGVWEHGAYTGRKVKAIFMPTLNNHSDYAGVTSAIKSFFGATEIHDAIGGTFSGARNIHTATYSQGSNGATYAGELAARYITKMYSPVLYITAAMFSGHVSRWDPAKETKTVLACTNPATLDYIACREVISPYAPSLNPDNDNNTRKQILGCISGGIGTIASGSYSVVRYDFDA